MALTYSTMLALGTQAPAFSLPDVVSEKTISLDSFKERAGLLVMFICRHCPYVQHIKQEMSKLSKDYANGQLGMVAISSNDVANYPDDSPESLREFAVECSFAFPLCFDETQKVAKDYTAACTPDFFLFDANLKLVYRGQLDDSRPGNNIPVTGKDLRAAINSVLQGKPVAGEQKPSAGCNIKWKDGNAPKQ